jgi:hypothetical protein
LLLHCWYKFLPHILPNYWTRVSYVTPQTTSCAIVICNTCTLPSNRPHIDQITFKMLPNFKSPTTRSLSKCVIIYRVICPWALRSMYWHVTNLSMQNGNSKLVGQEKCGRNCQSIRPNPTLPNMCLPKQQKGTFFKAPVQKSNKWSNHRGSFCSNIL